MDRFALLFLIFGLVCYFLGIIFAQKTISAILRLFSLLKSPINFIKEFCKLQSDRIFLIFVILIPISTFYLFYQSLGLDKLIQFLIVEGTFFAVIYSVLIKDIALKYRKRPKANLLFNFHEPDCHLTVSHTGIPGIAYQGIPTYYIRLRVLNEGGETINNAEVILEEVKNPRARLNTYLPLNLIWALTEVQENRGIVRIPQRLFRTLDLFKILEPTQTQ